MATLETKARTVTQWPDWQERQARELRVTAEQKSRALGELVQRRVLGYLELAKDPNSGYSLDKLNRGNLCQVRLEGELVAQTKRKNRFSRPVFTLYSPDPGPQKHSYPAVETDGRTTEIIDLPGTKLETRSDARNLSNAVVIDHVIIPRLYPEPEVPDRRQRRMQARAKYTSTVVGQPIDLEDQRTVLAIEAIRADIAAQTTGRKVIVDQETLLAQQRARALQPSGVDESRGGSLRVVIENRYSSIYAGRQARPTPEVVAAATLISRIMGGRLNDKALQVLYELSTGPDEAVRNYLRTLIHDRVAVANSAPITPDMRALGIKLVDKIYPRIN